MAEKKSLTTALVVLSSFVSVSCGGGGGATEGRRSGRTEDAFQSSRVPAYVRGAKSIDALLP